MRKLSLKTFLRRTLEALSERGQSAPYKLVRELEQNPRLLQPLCLYVAAAYDKAQQAKLLRLSPQMAQEFRSSPFLSCSGTALEQALEQLTDSENGYYKLWRSYVSLRDRQKADDHTKLLIHRAVRALQAEKRVSNYRLYTDLHLNPGNLNDWLTHQNCSKVSLDTARKALQYLRQYGGR